MVDTLSKEKRSEVMSRIRSHGNKSTELRFIEILREAGISGWRRHQKVFGKPDFVFRKQRVAVFVDGCFWHGCPKCNRHSASNRAFWEAKFSGNRKRDRLVTATLKRQGWRVVRIWEHQLKHPRRIASRLSIVLDQVRSS